VVKERPESFEKLVGEALALLEASLDDMAASCVQEPHQIFRGEVGAHEIEQDGFEIPLGVGTVGDDHDGGGPGRRVL
jgi:hypothetical protein